MLALNADTILSDRSVLDVNPLIALSRTIYSDLELNMHPVKTSS